MYTTEISSVNNINDISAVSSTEYSVATLLPNEWLNRNAIIIFFFFIIFQKGKTEQKSRRRTCWQTKQINNKFKSTKQN